MTVRSNPSTGFGGDVHDALPITTDDAWDGLDRWFQRVPLVGNTSLVQVAELDSETLDPEEGGDTVGINFGTPNSVEPNISPEITASLVVTPLEDGTVRIEWSRDSYPAMEAYHAYPDGRIVILADQPASDLGLAPILAFDSEFS